MTIRIAHLSDIHFGAEVSPAVAAAVAAVAAFAPTLTVVTGDLTLDGQPRDFIAARRWLDRLPGPLLVTPGNHDTPYWNLFKRALIPFHRYRRHIGEPAASGVDGPGLTARALNSARGGQLRLDWSKGALSVDALEAIDWGSGSSGALRLFACHHPLVDPSGAPVTGGMRSGREAAAVLAASGVELVLTGHVHVPFALPLGQAGQVCYAIGAGTLSVRTRGFPPSFSTIIAGERTFEVTAQGWAGDRFEPAQAWTLPRGPGAEAGASVEIAAAREAGLGGLAFR